MIGPLDAIQIQSDFELNLSIVFHCNTILKAYFKINTRLFLEGMILTSNRPS